MINDRSKFLVLWVMATGLGWAASGYVGFSMSSVVLGTVGDVRLLAFQLLVNGVILGSVVGVMQSLILRHWRKKAKWWLVATIVGYGFGAPLGLIADCAWDGLVAWSIGIPLFVQGSQAFAFLPWPMVMIFTGLFVAVLQWIALGAPRPVSRGEGVWWMSEAAHRWEMGILWVLGTILGWGMSYWASAWAFTAGLSSLFQNIVAGSIIGSATGTILVARLFLLDGDLDPRPISLSKDHSGST